MKTVKKMIQQAITLALIVTFAIVAMRIIHWSKAPTGHSPSPTPIGPTTPVQPTPTTTPKLEPPKILEMGTIEGKVFLQGRSNHQGATVCINDLPCTTSNPDGDFAIYNVPPGTYAVTASMPGYLSAQRSEVTVKGMEIVILPDVTLVGGDANNDDVINLSDLTIVGTAYSTSSPSDSQADIDGSGVVDILDLSLTGGNYGRTGPMSW